MPLSTRQKQNLFVIVGAGLTILASIFTTLYVASGKFETEPNARQGQGYKNITFTDAVITCKQYVEQQFGDSLRSLEIDDHSSRLEHRRFIYKIFLKAESPAKDRPGLALHYVNCFVNSASGSISKYETYEEKEETVSPITEDDSNMFGWPR